MKRRLRLFRLVFLSAAMLLAGACAPRSLPTADVDLDGIRSVALQPIVFRGEEPDYLCPSYIEGKLRRQLQVKLQEKGFNVILVNKGEKAAATSLAKGNIEAIVRTSPGRADAAAVLWVDALRELGYCSTREYKDILVEGTFALISLSEKKVLWKKAVTATHSLSPMDPAEVVAIEIARETAGRLPAVGR